MAHQLLGICTLDADVRHRYVLTLLSCCCPRPSAPLPPLLSSFEARASRLALIWLFVQRIRFAALAPAAAAAASNAAASKAAAAADGGADANAQGALVCCDGEDNMNFVSAGTRGLLGWCN